MNIHMHEILKNEPEFRKCCVYIKQIYEFRNYIINKRKNHCFMSNNDLEWVLEALINKLEEMIEGKEKYCIDYITKMIYDDIKQEFDNDRI